MQRGAMGEAGDHLKRSSRLVHGHLHGAWTYVIPIVCMLHKNLVV